MFSIIPRTTLAASAFVLLASMPVAAVDTVRTNTFDANRDHESVGGGVNPSYAPGTTAPVTSQRGYNFSLPQSTQAGGSTSATAPPATAPGYAMPPFGTLSRKPPPPNRPVGIQFGCLPNNVLRNPTVVFNGSCQAYETVQSSRLGVIQNSQNSVRLYDLAGNDLETLGYTNLEVWETARPDSWRPAYYPCYPGRVGMSENWQANWHLLPKTVYYGTDKYPGSRQSTILVGRAKDPNGKTWFTADYQAYGDLSPVTGVYPRWDQFLDDATVDPNTCKPAGYTDPTPPPPGWQQVAEFPKLSIDSEYYSTAPMSFDRGEGFLSIPNIRLRWEPRYASYYEWTCNGSCTSPMPPSGFLSPWYCTEWGHPDPSNGYCFKENPRFSYYYQGNAYYKQALDQLGEQSTWSNCKGRAECSALTGQLGVLDAGQMATYVGYGNSSVAMLTSVYGGYAGVLPQKSY